MENKYNEEERKSREDDDASIHDTLRSPFYESSEYGQNIEHVERQPSNGPIMVAEGSDLKPTSDIHNIHNIHDYERYLTEEKRDGLDVNVISLLATNDIHGVEGSGEKHGCMDDKDGCLVEGENMSNHVDLGLEGPPPTSCIISGYTESGTAQGEGRGTISLSGIGEHESAYLVVMTDGNMISDLGTCGDGGTSGPGVDHNDGDDGDTKIFSVPKQPGKNPVFILQKRHRLSQRALCLILRWC